MSTIAKTLAALPTPPSRADIANFDNRADEFLAALPTLAADINTVTGQINTVAGEMNAANTAAQSAKTGAQSAQAAAQAASSASAWSSATAYSIGHVVFGSNGHSYRALAANTNVNPVTDTSGKWLRITLALGDRAADAYPGNKGKAAYDHSLEAHAPANLAELSGLVGVVETSGADIFFNGDLYVRGPGSVIGYGNGSGGTVTQSVSKSTSVTLNKGAGAVTMHAASLAGGGTVSFVLNSNLISAMDVVVVGIAHNSVGNSSFYNVWASAYNGGAVITLQNISGGALAENVVLNFAVIKGYQS